MLRVFFLRSLDEGLRAHFSALTTLDRHLERVASETSGEWGVTSEEIAEAVAARIEATDVGDPEAALSSFRGHDLAVALGCARGNRRALATFEAEHEQEIDRAIKKSPNLGVTRDEFRQLMREKLFVAPPNSEPRIASYAGRAPLSAWVRVTCARTIIDLSRKSSKEPLSRDDDWLSEWPDTDDPELRLLREQYAPLLPAAFSAGLTKLTPRRRNLLRQRFLHDVSAQALAVTYGVHRATIFSWIEEARKDLMTHVRASLRSSVAKTSLDSLIDVMGSAMELSIPRLLDSKLEEE